VAVIEVRGLRKTYRDGTQAVRGIDFDVEAGEIFGLLGPNGAGKTTTMRILGTLQPATAGHVRVLGLDPARDAEKVRRRIGFAMQEVGMDDLATAEEMLTLHARLYGIGRRDARRRAGELLEDFGLGEHAGRRVTRFSGGMQRRLDLAVSLIHEPEVLFLDEPSTGLDPTSRADLWRVLRGLREEKGITILMSTHYMEEADALCDRIAIVADGRIAATDTPERLKRSLGADTIRIRLSSALDLAQAERVERVFEGAARVRGDVVTVKAKDGEGALLPVLQRAAAAGLPIVSTRVLRPTLDDVFVRYTGARLKEHEAGVEADEVDA